MRQLLPEVVDDVDPLERYGADQRPPRPDRPWVLVNMVATVDGATAVEGVSGPLGGPGDRRVFAALRTLPDVILVASSTVNAERYGPPATDDARTAWRADRGLTPVPAVAVVSGSLSVDPDLRLFTEAEGAGPMVLTATAADPERRALLAERARLLEAGDDRVDLAAALALLQQDGARVVLVEGGPSLNGQLLELDLVDEVCLTLSPVAAGGASRRVFAGAPAALRHLELHRVLEEDGTLFLCYRRDRGADR